MIAPGSFAANPMTPLPPSARYSVMNRPPPPKARPSAPRKLLAPAVWVVVLSRTLSVIQENSPGSAMITSPGSRPISRNGIVVPVIFDIMKTVPRENIRRRRPGRSIQLERLARQILGAVDRDQHRVALLVRIAVLLGLHQAAPYLVIDWARFVDFRGAVKAGDAAERKDAFLTQRRLPEIDRQLAAVRHCSRRAAPAAFPQADMLVVIDHRAAARGDLREPVGQHRAEQADIRRKRGVDVVVQDFRDRCHG